MMEPQPRTIAGGRRWKAWNQKAHSYVGLYFLVFLWLFALSGLLLNHGWQFAEFWPQRQQRSRTQAVTVPASGADLERARAVMRQLGLEGEIDWTAVAPQPSRFEFRVQHPGRTSDVRVDLGRGTAAVQETSVNGWGVFRTLHTFTGVRGNAAERDWWLTKLWSFSMDALAAGLVVLVLTSLCLAYERRERWRGAAIALALGTTAVGFFVSGLRWL